MTQSQSQPPALDAMSVEELELAFAALRFGRKYECERAIDKLAAHTAAQSSTLTRLQADNARMREALEPLQELALDLGRISGAIDNQVYREMVRHDWDPPDDCEFDVMLTTKHIVTIDRLHAALIKALLAVLDDETARAALHQEQSVKAQNETQ